MPTRCVKCERCEKAFRARTGRKAEWMQFPIVELQTFEEEVKDPQTNTIRIVLVNRPVTTFHCFCRPCYKAIYGVRRPIRRKSGQSSTRRSTSRNLSPAKVREHRGY